MYFASQKYVYHMYVRCLWSSEEGIRSPETGVTSGYEPPYGAGIKPRPSIRATSAFNF